MATWAEVLDDYAGTIDALERGIDAGEYPSSAGWQQPASGPSVPPTAADVARFRELQARAAACDTRLRAAMAEARSDLVTVRRTSAAARAYGRAEANGGL